MSIRDGDMLIEAYISRNSFRIKHILDIGYGKGNLIEILQKEGFSVSGIDPKGTELKGITTIQCSAEEYEPGIRHYDCIYMLKSFHHLNNPPAALRNLYSMLAMDGHFVIIDWKSPLKGIKSKLHGLLANNERHYTLKEAKYIVERAGFRTEHAVEGEHTFEIYARKDNFIMLFPIKDDSIADMDSCSSYLVSDSSGIHLMKTQTMPGHFDVLFTSRFGERERALNESGIVVYYSRGNIDDNMAFIKKLKNGTICKWTNSCPVGKRTASGEIPPYWVDNYCLAGNESCIRYIKESNHEAHSDRMLPDGTEYMHESIGKANIK